MCTSAEWFEYLSTSHMSPHMTYFADLISQRPGQFSKTTIVDCVARWNTSAGKQSTEPWTHPILLISLFRPQSTQLVSSKHRPMPHDQAPELSYPECHRQFNQAGLLKRHLRQMHQIPCLPEDVYNPLRGLENGTNTYRHCYICFPT